MRMLMGRILLRGFFLAEQAAHCFQIVGFICLRNVHIDIVHCLLVGPSAPFHALQLTDACVVAEGREGMPQAVYCDIRHAGLHAVHMQMLQNIG